MVDTTGATSIWRTKHVTSLDPRVLQNDRSTDAVDDPNAVAFGPQPGRLAAVGQHQTFRSQHSAIGQASTTGSASDLVERLHHALDEAHTAPCQRLLQGLDDTIGIDHAFAGQEKGVAASVGRSRRIGRLQCRLDPLVRLGKLLEIIGDGVKRLVLEPVGGIVVDQHGTQPVVLCGNLELFDKRPPQPRGSLAQFELKAVARFVQRTRLQLRERVEHGCSSHGGAVRPRHRAYHCNALGRNRTGKAGSDRQANHAVTNDQEHGMPSYSTLTMHRDG